MGAVRSEGERVSEVEKGRESDQKKAVTRERESERAGSVDSAQSEVRSFFSARVSQK